MRTPVHGSAEFSDLSVEDDSRRQFQGSFLETWSKVSGELAETYNTVKRRISISINVISKRIDPRIRFTL